MMRAFGQFVRVYSFHMPIGLFLLFDGFASCHTAANDADE